MVKQVARDKNEPHSQAERRVDTPIDQRQEQQKELLVAEVTKKTHGDSEPVPDGTLKANDKCNTTVD
jgi:hypothetical protein